MSIKNQRPMLISAAIIIGLTAASLIGLNLFVDHIAKLAPPSFAMAPPSHQAAKPASVDDSMPPSDMPGTAPPQAGAPDRARPKPQDARQPDDAVRRVRNGKDAPDIVRTQPPASSSPAQNGGQQSGRSGPPPAYGYPPPPPYPTDPQEREQFERMMEQYGPPPGYYPPQGGGGGGGYPPWGNSPPPPYPYPDNAAPEEYYPPPPYDYNEDYFGGEEYEYDYNGKLNNANEDAKMADIHDPNSLPGVVSGHDSIHDDYMDDDEID